MSQVSGRDSGVSHVGRHRVRVARPAMPDDRSRCGARGDAGASSSVKPGTTMRAATCQRFFRWYNREHRSRRHRPAHTGRRPSRPSDRSRGRPSPRADERLRRQSRALRPQGRAPPALPVASWINKPDEEREEPTRQFLEEGVSSGSTSSAVGPLGQGVYLGEAGLDQG